jgi:hypothetical protein
MRVLAITGGMVTILAAMALAQLAPSFAFSPGPCQPQYEQACQARSSGCQVVGCQGVGLPLPVPKDDPLAKSYASGYKCVTSTAPPNSYCSNPASGVVNGICCLGQCLASERMTCPNAEPGITCVIRGGLCQPVVTTCNPQTQNCAMLWQTMCGLPQIVMLSPAPVCDVSQMRRLRRSSAAR